MLLFRLHLPSAKPEELEGSVEFTVEGPGGGVEEDGLASIAVVVVESGPDWSNAHARCSSTAKVKKRYMHN